MTQATPPLGSFSFIQWLDFEIAYADKNKPMETRAIILKQVKQEYERRSK